MGDDSQFTLTFVDDSQVSVLSIASDFTEACRESVKSYEEEEQRKEWDREEEKADESKDKEIKLPEVPADFWKKPDPFGLDATATQEYSESASGPCAPPGSGSSSSGSVVFVSSTKEETEKAKEKEPDRGLKRTRSESSSSD